MNREIRAGERRSDRWTGDGDEAVGRSRSALPAGRPAGGWLRGERAGWGTPRRLERPLVLAIALHSLLVGALLLLFTETALRLAGWTDVQPLFFARQAGVFHLVIAAGYVIEHVRHGGVALLLVAKAAAVCFLLAMMLAGSTPWAVPVLGALDGLMAVAVLLVRGRRRSASGTGERAEA